jgi:hypothetical protein
LEGICALVAGPEEKNLSLLPLPLPLPLPPPPLPLLLLLLLLTTPQLPVRDIQHGRFGSQLFASRKIGIA